MKFHPICFSFSAFRWAAILALLALCAATPRGAQAGKRIKIVLTGDSTVTDTAGWGGVFGKLVKENVKSVNLSKGGRSSKSFRDEGRWDEALALKPDFILIQFGHNDQPGHGPGRETDPETTYRANMTQYVEDALAAGITPILVTPISRREFKDDGKIHSSLQPYADVVKQIAAEKNVQVVDLHWRSTEIYESLGREGCEMISPLKTGPKYDGRHVFDGTHLNEAGANLFGALMAKELAVTVPRLANRFPTSKLMKIQKGDPPRQPVDEAYVSRMLAKAGGFTAQGAKTFVADAAGNGDFLTIQEAIDAAPANNAERTTIILKPGVYMGQTIVPANKPNIALIGEDRKASIHTYALNTHDPVPATVPNKMRGNGFIVLADGFSARNMTFRNTSGDHGQAMALRIDGDRAIVSDCDLLAWQDTLLTAKGRHYYKECYIEGRVDYIYGAATAVFDNCEIQTKCNGYVTAASTPQSSPFGYAFLNCRLSTGNGMKTWLGRPWRPYAAVAYINCWMDSHIRPEGWHNWGKETNEQTARYSEYNTTGPGANPEKRVAWSKQLSDEEAGAYTVKNILGGADGWDPEAELAAMQ